MSVVRASMLCGCLTLLGACGGAAGGAKSPDATEDVDSLARDLEAAEQTLAGEIGGRAQLPGAGSTVTESSRPPEPTGGQSADELKKSEAPAVDAPPPPAQSSPSPASPPAGPPCETACKALASMKRSQTRICDLAGAGHERCSWAKQKVADATARVERAGCACE
jgi:hypothetical protein